MGAHWLTVKKENTFWGHYFVWVKRNERTIFLPPSTVMALNSHKWNDIIAIITSHVIKPVIYTYFIQSSDDFPMLFPWYFPISTAGSLHVSGASGGAALRWSACGAAPWEARYCHRVALLDDMVIMTGGHGAQGDGMVSQWFWMANCGLIMVNSGLRMVNSGIMDG